MKSNVESFFAMKSTSMLCIFGAGLFFGLGILGIYCAFSPTVSTELYQTLLLVMLVLVFFFPLGATYIWAIAKKFPIFRVDYENKKIVRQGLFGERRQEISIDNIKSVVWVGDFYILVDDKIGKIIDFKRDYYILESSRKNRIRLEKFFSGEIPFEEISTECRERLFKLVYFRSKEGLEIIDSGEKVKESTKESNKEFKSKENLRVVGAWAISMITIAMIFCVAICVSDVMLIYSAIYGGEKVLGSILLVVVATLIGAGAVWVINSLWICVRIDYSERKIMQRGVFWGHKANVDFGQIRKISVFEKRIYVAYDVIDSKGCEKREYIYVKNTRKNLQKIQAFYTNDITIHGYVLKK